MERIDWINGKVPVNRTNLNGMQDNIEESCVAVSSTQPTTGENVWIKKGKNLFNKDAISSKNYLSSAGVITSNSGWCITDFIAVQPNTDYAYQGLIIAGTAPHSAFYDEDKNFISSFKQATGDNVITTPSNAYYVRFSICLNDAQTGDVFDDINTFQLEQGSTSTDYEDYIDKEIYVKNDNGVFERFSKEEEEKDTGWRNLEIVNGTVYANDQTPQIRRIGKQVNIRGALKGITKDNIILVKIPTDCIPGQVHSFTCPGSGKRHNRFQIVGTEIIFNSTSLDIALTEDNWYPLCTTYFVD